MATEVATPQERERGYTVRSRWTLQEEHLPTDEEGHFVPGAPGDHGKERTYNLKRVR